MPNLNDALTQLRNDSTDQFSKGRSFERMLQRALQQHPGIYGDRFSNVWLWNDWPGRTGPDSGVDLVAEEAEGGLCAIQCKFFAPDTPLPRSAIDAFLAASEDARFTSRMFINTGGEIRDNALRRLTESPKHCRVLDASELDTWDVDWREFVDNPEDLHFRSDRRYTPHPYQKDAIAAVCAGFESHDRGQLILPCGTGKTAVTLWIAEQQVGKGGRVLYLVPSIALMAQTMREWGDQKKLNLRYVGICSDTRAGRNDEDAPLEDLDIPVTTNAGKILEGLRKERPDVMTVVFCTYQSLPLVADAQGTDAQSDGAPEFDLVICDEAHRTTGVEDTETIRKGRQGKYSTSPFRLVHDPALIRTRKRLYTTATPRIFTAGAKSRARDADRNLEVFSMDDESVFGPVFYRMAFSQAIEGGWLTDYKVIILTLKSERVAAALDNLLAREKKSGLNLDDAVKLLGCWDALADPEGVLSSHNVTGDRHNSLMRAITFTNTIKASKLVKCYWKEVVETFSRSPDGEHLPNLLPLEVKHVDGTQDSLNRQRKLNWLREDNDEVCRVLSNARCLSEGVDVPALDAVLFLEPRKSQVDVVQAVGRVMRRAEGKEMGYIILPVVISPDQDPEKALDDNKTFQVVWSVLRALRSHDDRFDLEINSLDLNQNLSDHIKIIDDNGGDDVDDEDRIAQLRLDLIYKIPPGAIYARIVEKCGDRKYWPQWAEDVAQIADRIRSRVAGMLDDPGRTDLQRQFQSFLDDLRQTLNPEIREGDLVAMIAQHLVTEPVFKALFADYDFAGRNPVSRSLNRLVDVLEAEGLVNETRDLEPFYESVRNRASALDNAEARQKVLLELYERFFKVALRKDAERLGIVYTPVEVVDFILKSADHALQKHFGRRLSDENVHILDPFTGTGTFIVRLLQNPALVRDEDLLRKFSAELHANEIVLLAYYIAAINIEETFHGRLGMEEEYQPFGGIAFTDTFNLDEGKGQIAATLPANSERVKRQQAQDITVIVGNPPYSSGQQRVTDDNPNVTYPYLEQRVRETHVARSNVTNNNIAYDSYKMAIRWANDRLGREGVIAFVTNGSFIKSNVDAGLRACLADDFSHLYIVNLKGDQRTQGERSKQEGGKIFGSGSRAPIAILVLVRDPDHLGSCEIHYRDVGDYLSRDDKLRILRDWECIEGISAWQTIIPDEYNDWLNHRDPEYKMYVPLCSQEAKRKRNAVTTVIARLYSSGVNTGRNAWFYAFDRFKWDDDLQDRLRTSMFRPYVKMRLYFETPLIQRRYQMQFLFPAPEASNQIIGVTGKGETAPFSVLTTSVIPDRHLVSSGQWFPRYRYERIETKVLTMLPDDRPADSNNVPGYRRVDNLTDWGLGQFQNRYPALTITKDNIWNYLYGLLHAPDYREKYRNDLSKDLPRIPFAPDFEAFCSAGEQLAALHLGYETCTEYELQEVVSENAASPYRLDNKGMKWGGTRKEPDRTILHVTPQVTLRGIPAEAQDYVVNGRTPLAWAIDRLKVTTDKESGIVSDPNAWYADDPAELVAHLRRLVHVSVETAKIVSNLPPALE